MTYILAIANTSAVVLILRILGKENNQMRIFADDKGPKGPAGPAGPKGPSGPPAA